MGSSLQLMHFKAKAQRLKEECEQLKADLAWEKSTVLMLRSENEELRELLRKNGIEVD